MSARSFPVRRVCMLLALFSVMWIGGCEMGASAPPTAPSASKAVVAKIGQGTTVFLPAANGTVKTLSTTGDPACPQCQADAAAYFQSGTLSAKCPQCGADRTAAIGHQ